MSDGCSACPSALWSLVRIRCLMLFRTFPWCYLDTSAFSFIPAFALLWSYMFHPTTRHQSGIQLCQFYSQRWATRGHCAPCVICGVYSRWHLYSTVNQRLSERQMVSWDTAIFFFLKQFFCKFFFLNQVIKRDYVRSGKNLLSSSAQHWSMLLSEPAKII